MNMERLNTVLSNLKIGGNCIKSHYHKHLAFYDVELDPGTTVSKLERRTKEIALALRSKTLPIVKLMPELGCVRLQVAHKDVEIVSLSNLLTLNVPAKMALPFVLGETDEGKPLVVDMSSNPHLLIAGGTGSGKSVALHAIIANAAFLRKNHLRNIEVYLSDPKRVEFVNYDNKHCSGLIQSISYDYNSTVNMLRHVFQLMELRYNMLSKSGLTSVEDAPHMFSRVLVIIDEVADLVLQDKKGFPMLVVKLAQKARAAGIHLILATQRPSVDILTGLIKANFPGRLSCKVASKVDSQVILDSIGAESLLGRGDSIFQNPMMDRVRFQGAFITSKEIVKLLF